MQGKWLSCRFISFFSSRRHPEQWEQRCVIEMSSKPPKGRGKVDKGINASIILPVCQFLEMLQEILLPRSQPLMKPYSNRKSPRVNGEL